MCKEYVFVIFLCDPSMIALSDEDLVKSSSKFPAIRTKVKTCDFSEAVTNLGIHVAVAWIIGKAM